MPGWQQGVGGQPVYADTSDGLEAVTTEDGEVITHDDAGGWLALSLRQNGAMWVQAAGDQAVYADTPTGLAVVTTEDELEIVTHSDSGGWLALGAHSIATAFSQAPGAWSAEGSQELTATGSWQQSASWAAVGVGATPIVFTPGILPLVMPDLIEGQASFAQPPASWRAVMDVNNDEPLLLSDLLELVA